eukprot:1160731-Pelagomonas_calceolata.AAC.5
MLYACGAKVDNCGKLGTWYGLYACGASGQLWQTGNKVLSRQKFRLRALKGGATYKCRPRGVRHQLRHVQLKCLKRLLSARKNACALYTFKS